MNWKFAFVIVLALIAIVGSVALVALEKSFSKTVTDTDLSVRTIQLAGQELYVSVAETPEARVRGLSGRTSLASNEGMLFIFDTAAKYGFWMKDMLFSIDILWLSDTGEVVYMEESILPATYPDVFAPNVPARYVLELPAGFAEAYSVKVGDIVRL